MTTRPVALVTGSGRKRLGYHIAKGLATAGFDIALHFNRSRDQALEVQTELKKIGGRVEVFSADVSNFDNVDRLCDQVMDSYGHIDLLVNTASVWKRIPLEEITAQDVQQQVGVDLMGTFFCCRKIGLQMVAQSNGGAIVNFSDWAVNRPYPDHAAYFSVKGSIPTMTKCLARELGTRNPKVRVNCILPGPVLLPPDASESQRQQLLDSTLVQQVDRPDAVVAAVLHFTQNDFITGTCLPVDGGRSVYAFGEQH